MMNRWKPFGCKVRRAVLCGFAAVGLTSLAFLPHFARADSLANNAPASALFRSPQSTAQLVSAVAGTGDLESIPTAIHVVLQPGWKTYWRSPGDAGYPMQVDSTGSTNVARVDLAWPVPHRFELFGLQTFGYGEEVAFPLQVIPQRKGEAISLKAKLRYLVCEVVCVPQDAQLSLDVPAGAAMPTDAAPLVNRFTSLVPQGEKRLGWSVISVRLISPTELVIDLHSEGESFSAPDAIVEGARDFYIGPPRVQLSGQDREARLTLPVERLNSGPELVEHEVTLTIFDGERAVEVLRTPFLGDIILRPYHGTSAVDIVIVMLVALLGGLILNVMPCVLPVLVLKLTSVLDMAGRERDHLRGAFLSTAAGIVCSFLVLAAGLIALKTAGAGVGWGIQFQQPVFLAAMALVCILFAANIWGLFEIPMPAFAGRAQLAADARVNGAHAKSFFTGVLATALATPCSAPFVGTAVGFALARGPVEILAIFLALGLGLASPYLAVAAAPDLVRLLPRPGRWMRWLKGLLAITLLGTAIWLISIIGVQTGLLSGGAGGDRIAWVKFDEGAIAAQVAEGKVVFVDVTADWCLTCQANKKLVLDRDAVATRLQEDGIVAMKADWTNPDPAISAFLERHGRYGIPFNIVYGPAAPDGLKLPELLTGANVLEALDSAARAK